MANAEDFIEQCQKVISEYEAGKKSLVAAAAQINASPFEYPFDGQAHPMIYEVADLAFDIAEDYRSEKDDKAGWALLTKTLNKYVEGNWEPTCWILSAIYGEYDGNKIHHSCSVEVRRQNGRTIIETAIEEIKDVISNAIKGLNPEQTDERYLQNLAVIVSKNSVNYRLASVEVKEYLTKPYNSTVASA